VCDAQQELNRQVFKKCEDPKDKLINLLHEAGYLKTLNGFQKQFICKYSKKKLSCVYFAGQKKSRTNNYFIMHFHLNTGDEKGGTP
jgi:hypothetical protein